MRGKRHSEEVRAQVMAALLAGQGVAEVAATYRLPEQTVSDWKKQAEEQFGEVRTKKGARIEALLFDYLSSNLRALKVQADVFSDPAYLKGQPADQAAVLHGVMADKGIRLLEALANAIDTDSEETGEAVPV